MVHWSFINGRHGRAEQTKSITQPNRGAKWHIFGKSDSKVDAETEKDADQYLQLPYGYQSSRDWPKLSHS